MRQNKRKQQDDRLLKQLPRKERRLQEGLRQQILSDPAVYGRRSIALSRHPSQVR